MESSYEDGRRTLRKSVQGLNLCVALIWSHLDLVIVMTTTIFIIFIIICIFISIYRSSIHI